MDDCFPHALSKLEQVSAVVSYLLSVLLIWLIVRRTPQKLRGYSRLLFCNCVVDMVFATANYLVRPVTSDISARGTVITMATTGPLIDAPLPTRFAAFNVLFFVQYVVICTVTLPFVYRYYRLCRNHTIEHRGLAGMMIVVALAAACIGIGSYVVFRPYAYSHPIEQSATECVLAGSVAFIDVARPELSQLTLLASCCIVLSLSYGIIIVCSWKFYGVLRNAREGGRVSRTGGQITVVMGLQAVTPLVLFIIPLGGTIVSIICGYNVIRLIESTYGFLVWLPALNPFYALAFVSAYRNALTRMLIDAIPSTRVYTSST